MRHLRLDRYDLAILSALQQDGRMSKLRLADKIHLSPTPCWERLRRLEREGLILGYHAEVAISELLDVAHFLVEVTLSRHRAEDFSRFEQSVENRPEVLTCYAVAGGFDYLLLVVAGDISDYQSLLQNWLETETGAERFFTYVVTRTVKQIKAFPIERFWNNRKRNEPNA